MGSIEYTVGTVGTLEVCGRLNSYVLNVMSEALYPLYCEKIHYWGYW